MGKCLTFKGGVHPLHAIHEGKQLTEKSAITEMPAPAVVSIPMSQHVGAPAKPIVEAGQRVLMGQVIGEANGFVSVPVHSSVSGTVKEVTNILGLNGKPVRAVIIENDGQDEACTMPPLDYETASCEEIIGRIRDAGIVGMGGATFPTHVKLSPPEEKEINLLILNGAECEPFLTADHRMMLEHADKMATGIKILMKALGVKKAIVGIENNKPDAIAKLQQAVDTHSIHVVAVKTKYPQGSEKQLIDAITGRIVPSGGLPMDAGVVVVNVSTAAAIADAFLKGESLTRRAVTVTGAVKEPQNLMVRIGTSTGDVINHAGGFAGEPLKVISGGPMMGLPVPDLSCVITRGYSGVLVLDGKYTKKEKQSNCIKCGRCVDVCPIYLNPTIISAAATVENFEKAEEEHAMDCINCGSCSFTCPAKIPLAQNIKFAKEMVMVNRLKEKEKQLQQENC